MPVPTWCRLLPLEMLMRYIISDRNFAVHTQWPTQLLYIFFFGWGRGSSPDLSHAFSPYVFICHPFTHSACCVQKYTNACCSFAAIFSFTRWGKSVLIFVSTIWQNHFLAVWNPEMNSICHNIAVTSKVCTSRWRKCSASTQHNYWARIVQSVCL